MKRKLKEANDSWDGMFPVNINKRSIPSVDLGILKSEEEQFRVFDITMPNTLKILGDLLVAGLIEHRNEVSPINTIHQVRMIFNRAGYDFAVTPDRLAALKDMKEEGYVDFPLTSGTSALYPYEIDQTYPGYRVENDGIEKKLGYKLVVRIHNRIVSVATSDGQGVTSQYYDGEIVPQDS